MQVTAVTDTQIQNASYVHARDYSVSTPNVAIIDEGAGDSFTITRGQTSAPIMVVL
jgi:hypothetical protein